MKVLLEAQQEAQRSLKKYNRPYASAHEFYGVLAEEIDELWDEIKLKEELRDIEKMRKEAVQCMAVLYRFITELDNELH
jgi:NTP pyrophosphatase (non-canonical NTP hydrolase)